ncbi:SGNH/GDSL hydrolase family protein [Promicromonospora sukumoe]|uniref:Lysophospholipase L1-like esterase n=1 Tax=Promicromonospora sukumoe TaxID=88382 RepID=A0A7W3PD50_9MICO|nr:SGNH/GDSL hydrolase family protein [Promicromonospora sukumoe]MBA8807134.1 lysophospholipase L1-like esterase [Promicromonospora sukumoe]
MTGSGTTERLVFVGDSITDAGRDRADATSLGDGYVRLVAAALPGAQVRNLGIGGDRAVDLEARWDRDVAASAPDVLTLYVGVNDTWRRFDADDPTSAEDFEATYRRLLDRVPGSPRLVLVEPFLLPVRPEQQGWLDDLAGKREVVGRLAAETGATPVPLHTVLTAAAEHAGAQELAPDGVHPTPAASQLIADAWLAAHRSGAPSAADGGAKRSA